MRIAVLHEPLGDRYAVLGDNKINEALCKRIIRERLDKKWYEETNGEESLAMDILMGVANAPSVAWNFL